jgi:hypothetical protein
VSASRREVLLGAVGAAASRRFNRPPVSLDLSIGQAAQPGLVRATMSRTPIEALTGVGASLLRRASATCSPWLRIDLEPGVARLSLPAPNRECVVSLRNGCEGFVASWALPVVQHGVIGYDPARELPLLLSSGAGEYWCLREGEGAPAALAGATAVYACFFGDYQQRTFERMQLVVERFTRELGPGANFIFNAVIDAAHEAALLLTVFRL